MVFSGADGIKDFFHIGERIYKCAVVFIMLVVKMLWGFKVFRK